MYLFVTGTTLKKEIEEVIPEADEETDETDDIGMLSTIIRNI